MQPDPLQPRQVLAEGRYVRLVRQGRWEYAERTRATGAVVIVALTDEGSLVLIEQYRLPVGCAVVELPAGITGDDDAAPGEPDAEAARRELLEETGYYAGELTLLASGPPSAGLASEVVSFFLARRLRRDRAGGGDDSEQILVHEVPVSQVPSWLDEQARTGKMVDPKVYAGLFFAGKAAPNNAQ